MISGNLGLQENECLVVERIFYQDGLKGTNLGGQTEPKLRFSLILAFA